MAHSKKLNFSKSPIPKIFSQKFHRLVLGVVGLIDAKGTDVNFYKYERSQIRHFCSPGSRNLW